jgi:hypothetical protein
VPGLVPDGNSGNWNSDFPGFSHRQMRYQF